MQHQDAVKNGTSTLAAAESPANTAGPSGGTGRADGFAAWWARATSGVTLVTLAAIISTALSFQGMYSTTTATLGMPAAFGLALSGFLELAVLGVARLLQNAIKEGRSAVVERVGTWVLSLASGVFSAAHQLVSPADAEGMHHWSLGDPLTQIAAGLRLAAPLVACWLWERRLRGERAHAAQRRTRHVAHRDRHIMRVALAAAAVRTARATTSGRRATGLVGALLTVRRLTAAARLRRRYIAFWRRYPITDPAHHAALMAGLRAAGLGDLLPELTAPNSALLTVVEQSPIRVTRHDEDGDADDVADPSDEARRRGALDVAALELAAALPAVAAPAPARTDARVGEPTPEPATAQPVGPAAGPAARPTGPLTPDERTLILDLAATPGVSEREIARRTGRSRDTIKRTIVQHRPATSHQERPADRPATGFTVAPS
ncbi:hypothetical protein ACIOWF_20620 [Cellulosimicrobium cellulans]|uniref:hypothetical protein n=1 Tax=Cellulosimicrobium cellulans TaxID=1710 RepID=UPI0037F52D1F